MLNEGIASAPVNIDSPYEFELNEYPIGLRRLLYGSKDIVRYIILDDSGSMVFEDGKLDERNLTEEEKGLVNVKNVDRYGFIKSTRWRELIHTVKMIVNILERANIKMIVVLLNSDTCFEINETINNKQYLFDTLEKINCTRLTPLCQNINKFLLYKAKNPANYSLIIITDGESSDGDMKIAMRPLENIDILVTVKLCTNSDRLLNYWNDIDKNLEFNIDIIDDFVSESREVSSVNSWINYNQILHSFKLLGCNTRKIDFLDEKPLSQEEKLKFINEVFGLYGNNISKLNNVMDSVNQYNKKVYGIDKKGKYNLVEWLNNNSDIQVNQINKRIHNNDLPRQNAIEKVVTSKKKQDKCLIC